MGALTTLIARDGHGLSAWRSGPETATRGLVIVQEIFGVNAHMRRVADAFAADGYAVIAPALFDRVARGVELGYGADDLARGRALRGQVPQAGILADIDAARVSLGERPTGIVGYCWGGTVAWWGATRAHGFAAAVGWYGGGIAATSRETPRCPVQLHFGETDTSIPSADVAAIRAAQPGVEIFTYPGAGHGFGCDDRPTFDAEATGLARWRTLAFLDSHLVQ